MAKELPPFLRHYDRLAAVAVLAVLLVSLIYLVVAGLSQQENVSRYNVKLQGEEPDTVQVKRIDLKDNEALLKRVATPGKSELLTVRNDPDAPNLCTPARRLLCVACAQPIDWKAAQCPYCKGEQPKEKKIDLATVDTDGDGLPDVWEVKYKLDRKNPADADLDTDGDGFTNLEEFEAKTDPTDPKVHPSYDKRLSLTAIAGTKLPLRVVNKMELPSTKAEDGTTVRHYQLTFVSVDAEGKPGSIALRVNDGEAIGSSGFRFVRYNEKPKKTIQVGKHKQTRFIEVSTIDVVREKDGKQATLVFWDENNPEWPGEPLLEQKATIAIDLPGHKPVVVAPGATFNVKGESYRVRAVDAEKKTVLLEKKADGTVFELK